MKKIFVMSCLLFCFSGAFAFSVQAQYTPEKMSVKKAEQTLKETLTEDVEKAAQPLNKKLDYITANYDDGEIRALIKNYEKTNRKMAARQGEPYVPYDRKIDVNNPQKVKRYFRKRIDIVF